MPQYVPLNYGQINVAAGCTFPSVRKDFNNRSFAYWERSLFQRACSTLTFDLPEAWQGSVRDYFYYCLFKFGYVAIFNDEKFGLAFQPCSLTGYDFYYQPTSALVANPVLNKEFKIHQDCEILKLTPDYYGNFDTITYFASKLANLDNAIDMSITNSKLAYIIGARNKTSAEALKKIFDKVNRGEPTVIYDQKLLNDPTDKDSPFQFLERGDMHEGLLGEQLQQAMTILNQFDAEIGIPTIPYQKKERMVTSEAESRQIDATSRSLVWLECLKSSNELVKSMFGIDLNPQLRYNPDDMLETSDDAEVSAE